MYSTAHSYAILDPRSCSVILKSRSLVNGSHRSAILKRTIVVANAEEILAYQKLFHLLPFSNA